VAPGKLPLPVTAEAQIVQPASSVDSPLPCLLKPVTPRAAGAPVLASRASTERLGSRMSVQATSRLSHPLRVGRPPGWRWCESGARS
jgi:hypothetical protein